MIKAHFIPRGYLKNFCHDNTQEKFFVYDKNLNRSWPTDINKVACEKGFYAFMGLREIGIDMEYIEHHFENKIEQPYYKQIENIVNLYNRTPKVDYCKKRIFEESSKKQLSLFIVYQLLRTKEYREYITQLYELVLNEAVKDGNGDEVILQMTKKGSKLLHIESITDNQYVTMLAFILYNYIWIIGVNSASPFYTSDNPIVIRSKETPEELCKFHLFGKVGTEIVYPINSSLILLMFERTYYKKMLSLENGFYELGEDDVKEYNAMQVTQSYNQVFCVDDNFELAREVCKTIPHSADKDRIRITFDDPFATKVVTQVRNTINSN